MELKIRIKEVKEEIRPITLKEKGMFLISTDMRYPQNIRDEIRKRLDALGLLIRVDSENIVFRTETIRDATPEEIIAWHCTQIWKPCDMIEGKCVANCPKKGVCEVVLDYKKSMAILEGKDVILELVD